MGEILKLLKLVMKKLRNKKRIGLKERLKDKALEPKSSRFSLQWFDHWATIFSLITSTFFAAYAIYLSHRQEETDKKVGLLEKILETNQELLLSNRDMQMQNKEMIDELIRQGNVQNAQLGYLAKSNEAVTSQYSIVKEKQYWDDRTSFLEYWDVSNEFFELTGYFSNGQISKKEFLMLSIEEKLKLFSKLENSIDKLRQNQSLIKDFNFRWDLGVLKDMHIKFYKHILQLPDDKKFGFELNGQEFRDKEKGQEALYDWFEKHMENIAKSYHDYQRRQFVFQAKKK